MKVHVEIDCSPEEARRFMGLPDVEKANEIYVDALSNAMKGVSNVDQLQEFTKHIAPMGQFGLKLFKDFMDSSAAFSGTSPDESPKGGKSKD